MGEAVCEACGARNASTAQFCRTCGAYLGWDGAARLLSDEELEAEAQRRREHPGGVRAAADVDGTDGAEGRSVGVRPPCPVCGTRAEPGRCYCRRCGHALSEATAPQPVRPGPVPWWRRWRTREAEQARAARAAYRRSLPVRYRVTRVLAGTVVVAGLAGMVQVADREPVTWVRSAAADLRGATEPVRLQAVSTAPAAGEAAEHPARHAVDEFADSWWATTLDPGGPPLGTGCDAPGDVRPNSVLVLDLEGPTVLRELWVTAGPPEEHPQSATWTLPVALVVRIDDRTCQRLALDPELEPQRHEFRHTAERLVIAAVAAAERDEPVAEVRTGIADVELRSRGG